MFRLFILRTVAAVLCCSGNLMLLTGVLSASVPSFAQAEPALSSKLVPPKFVDVAQQRGIHFQHQAPHVSEKYLIETMGSGAAFFDCDNDGRLDIFLANGAPFRDPTPKGTIPRKSGPLYWDRLYHQRPDGSFEDITERAGVQGVGYDMGVAVGDYDNDGNEDFYVTGYGGNHLYHNNGNCTFSDVTDEAGVGGSGWSSSAAWVDLDNDGRLDLVVLRYVTWDWNDKWCGPPDNRGYCHPDVFQPISMLVYHNNGDGRFTEEAHEAGLDKPAKALGIAIADYDRDGHIDLFVANDSMPEFLFHNKGNGTFEEVGLDSETAVNGEGGTYAGMGVDFSDFDNDGYPDLIVSDLANQRYALYRNNRDGTFNYDSYITGMGGITLLHSGWGMRFVDYDNDGWKDLLIAQGHDLDTVEKISPQLHYREPMLLLRNLGGRKFMNVGQASEGVFQQRWVGRGLAVGDIDNDGRMDAVVAENGGSAHVLMNETPSGNHWIGFKLIGHKSNRDGIGALIEVATESGSQWYTVSTSSSYLSSSDARAHFGLAGSVTAKAVRIRWPSGVLQTLQNVKGDRYITVDEPVETTGRGVKQ